MSKTTKTDLVFYALGNRVRRQIMDVVKRQPGCSVNDVCEHFEISRIGVMKQLNILVEANLVISRKAGRKRQLFFNAAPIQMIYDRWTDEYSAFWVTQAVDLKYQVEREMRTKASAKRKKSKRGQSTDATATQAPDSKPKRQSKRQSKRQPQRKTKASQ